MAELPERPTLADYQKLVEYLATERGYQEETVVEVMLLLTEEVGELAKAIRKLNGQKVGAHSKHHEAADELGDCLWLLVDISNRLGIDLEQAFREKELKNQARKLA